MRQHCPDLIILDIMMPGIDGYEVCSRLKSNTKTSGIMVLFLSAKMTLEDKLTGYDVDADDYIIKPYDPEELKAKVRILLRLKNVQDELRDINQNLEKLVEHRTRELVKKERQALIGQMVQGIIHNLQGPITGIQGLAELASMRIEKFLKNSKGGAGNSRELVQKVSHDIAQILNAVDSTELLISNMLARSRNEAIEKKQDLNLNDLIMQELEFLNSDSEIKHGINKSLDLNPSIPELSGIYTDFSQVVYNMIKNASDAMLNSDRKELSISTKYDENNIYLEFQDTGSGIAPENLGRIFDPFFTTKPIKASEKEGEPTGTGLGLHACSELMKPYGAEISVKSKLDEGTTFTITIPLHKIGTGNSSWY
ncbi:MAG: hybrid sensor histidine kinase/response regulator [Thermodesulfobacteriota bacterium]|nr:hybrid sensor histidine kinase/response regulator [Thermodesulfobacteriota bacterium]